MKPLRNLQDQSPNNIPDLVAHLWRLYHAMTLDPALALPAEHMRKAVVALEETRQMALQVWQEQQAASHAPRKRRTKKTQKDDAENAAEWLRMLPPASPLKQ